MAVNNAETMTVDREQALKILISLDDLNKKKIARFLLFTAIYNIRLSSLASLSESNNFFSVGALHH